MFAVPTYTNEEHKIVFGFMDYLVEGFLKNGVKETF